MNLFRTDSQFFSVIRFLDKKNSKSVKKLKNSEPWILIWMHLSGTV